MRTGKNRTGKSRAVAYRVLAVLLIGFSLFSFSSSIYQAGVYQAAEVQQAGSSPEENGNPNESKDAPSSPESASAIPPDAFLEADIDPVVPESESDIDASLPEEESDADSSMLEEEGDAEEDITANRSFLNSGTGTEVVVNGWSYLYFNDGTAVLWKATGASGHIMFPETIKVGSKTYTVTTIGGYDVWESQYNQYVIHGAFEDTKITGITFPENTLLRIGDRSFRNCTGLAGKTITIPESVFYVGSSAFYFSDHRIPIAQVRHPHRAEVTGSLPSLESDEDTPLTVPPEASAYTSVVDSTHKNTLLHKGARWLDKDLTEAEIRIDFGRQPNRNGKVDFVFVLDQSSSMVQSTELSSSKGSYVMPRYMITNDIVYGASELLLNSGIPGYDNRVALVGFGDSKTTPWTYDFTDNAGDIEEALYQHPLSIAADTNYEVALSATRDLIKARKDTRRPVVVVFLSDGVPTEGHSTVPAGDLRTMKANVYPLAIYMKKNTTGTILKALSHDGNTLYEAEDTSSFIQIVMEMAEDIIMKEADLQITLDDVLSEYYDLYTGKRSDIDVSSGKVNIVGDKVEWVLDGGKSGEVHTATIHVKLKPGTELDEATTGPLPTNSSLGATDGTISATDQPVLERYLVLHRFESEDPKQTLPSKVLALLPGNTGGYNNGDKVYPTALNPKKPVVEDSDGHRWEFVGWNADSANVNKANVTFVGKWRRAALDFNLIKTDLNGKGLADAVFDMYMWKGSSRPGPNDDYITPSSAVVGKWEKQNTTPLISAADGAVFFTFPEPGTYQLVEAAPPPGYYKPDVQWRIEVNANFTLGNITTYTDGSKVLGTSHLVPEDQSGTRVYKLANYPEVSLSFLKVSSVHYHGGQVSAEVLPGAELKLYYWNRTGSPPDTELVTEEGIRGGRWVLVREATSDNNGKVSFTIPAKSGSYYQLVETTAPANYLLPTGQWRISFKADGSIDTGNIKRIPGADGKEPPEMKVMEDGQFTGKLVLMNRPTYEMPSMGGHGKTPYVAAGVALLLAGIAVAAVYRAVARKRHIRNLTDKRKPKP